jgi:protein-tyrosine phosphatase
LKGYNALRAFKDRPQAQPFTIHLGDPGAADRYVDLSRPVLRRLVSKVFPGPVTLIVDVSDEVIESKLRALELNGEARSRLYHHNTVGLRCPDDPRARQILDSIDAPVIASSANRRGQPPPHDAEAATAVVGEHAELIVDGGRCRYSKASTIVRVSTAATGTTRVTVERAGVYDERFIRKLLRWTMLLVCSGNTCRSPMAEMIGTQLLADRRGLKPDELEAAGLGVKSAGTFAAEGAPASPEAVEAMQRMGLDLSGHRSRPLAPELIHEADVIYCMTAGHREMVLAMSPSASDKVETLDPTGDIHDPMGTDTTSYQRCAELIRRRLEARLKEQQP